MAVSIVCHLELGSLQVDLPPDFAAGAFSYHLWSKNAPTMNGASADSEEVDRLREPNGRDKHRGCMSLLLTADAEEPRRIAAIMLGPLDRSVLEEFATSVAVDASGRVTTELPTGFVERFRGSTNEFLAGLHWMLSGVGDPPMRTNADVSSNNGALTGKGFGLFAYVTTASYQQLFDGLLPEPKGVTKLSIHGNKATLTDVLGPVGMRYLEWFEAGMTYSLQGTLAADELIHIAESLRPISDDQWKAIAIDVDSPQPAQSTLEPKLELGTPVNGQRIKLP